MEAEANADLSSALSHRPSARHSDERLPHSRALSLIVKH
jgi:hypothetical protein